MANLEQIVSRKTENDTKWKEQQQAERDNTTAMQDAGVMEITTSPMLMRGIWRCRETTPHTAPEISHWSCSATGGHRVRHP